MIEKRAGKDCTSSTLRRGLVKGKVHATEDPAATPDCPPLQLLQSSLPCAGTCASPGNLYRNNVTLQDNRL